MLEKSVDNNSRGNEGFYGFCIILLTDMTPAVVNDYMLNLTPDAHISTSYSIENRDCIGRYAERLDGQTAVLVSPTLCLSHHHLLKLCWSEQVINRPAPLQQKLN